VWSERIHTFPDPVRSRRPEDEEDGDAPRSERKRLRASHQPWFQDSDGSEVFEVGEGMEYCGSYEDTGTLILSSPQTRSSTSQWPLTWCWIPSTADTAWPGTDH
jgi:hypothetical protein